MRIRKTLFDIKFRDIRYGMKDNMTFEAWTVGSAMRKLKRWNPNAEVIKISSYTDFSKHDNRYEMMRKNRQIGMNIK